MTRPTVDMRTIFYEPVFHESSFVGQNFCDQAMQKIKKSDLMVFTRIPMIAYPDLVREFYRKFRVDTDERGSLKVTVKISGVEYSFGRKDIAKALGIPRYKAVTGNKSDIEMMVELMKNPRAGCSELRASSLDENFWMVDRFLRAYVCPFAHDNIVPKYGYRFWHSLFTRDSVDVPLLVIEMMEKSCHGGRKKNPHGLILPRTITAILKVIGCNVNPEVMTISSFDVFSYQTEKKSLNALGRQVGLIPKQTRAPRVDASEEEEDDGNDDEGRHEEEEERHDYEHGGSSAPPNMGTQNDWESFARTQNEMMHGMDARLQSYGSMMDNMNAMMQSFGPAMQGIGSSIQGLDTRVSSLETQVGGMRGQMDDFAFEQHELYMMQRLSMTHTYGEQRANEMFNEANVYAESAQPRRRGRRRHNPAAHNDDAPME